MRRKELRKGRGGNIKITEVVADSRVRQFSYRESFPAGDADQEVEKHRIEKKWHAKYPLSKTLNIANIC